LLRWRRKPPARSRSPIRGAPRRDGARGVAVPSSRACRRRRRRVMMVRRRKSRIYFRRQLFDYRSASMSGRCGSWVRHHRPDPRTYLWSAAFPIRTPSNLEEFFITVRGASCTSRSSSPTREGVGRAVRQISADGANSGSRPVDRRMVSQWARRLLRPTRSIEQRDVETSLIERSCIPARARADVGGPRPSACAPGGGARGHRADRVRLVAGPGDRRRAVEMRPGRASAFDADLVFRRCRPELVPRSTRVPPAARAARTPRVP